ncbi:MULTISPECIES: protease HtpX [unclassified Neptuniibacter]|uniref:protease HtpX n=1 Tax=unclassified Neptuniibacter TaxID=2630693 RepID=UPI0025DA7F98|nr:MULTISPECIES: protease HtpX [unclassified Neptuniibacter]|tara:strand:+ start:7339 stop:8232 length:894 start_codon:yes stop_codon:yes gene_type:complete
MMRIGLFLLTNIAVLIVASITLNLLGVEHYISDTGLNLTSLLIFCAVFGFIGSFISLFLSKKMAKMSTGTEIITQARNADEQWLLDTVAELSQSAGIKMPEVGIFPAQQANAFATGWNKNDALVAVSLGLLQRFQKEEVKAVMAHEIGHVANGDMVTMTLVQGVINTFVMFFARIAGYAVDSFLKSSDDNSPAGSGIGYFITVIVFEIIFGILASFIVSWFSRYREFRADEAGAQLSSNHAMIGALQRLKAEYDMPDQMPGQLTAFGINSHIKSGLMELMSSHPPLDKRIAALQNRK